MRSYPQDKLDRKRVVFLYFSIVKDETKIKRRVPTSVRTSSWHHTISVHQVQWRSWIGYGLYPRVSGPPYCHTFSSLVKMCTSQNNWRDHILQLSKYSCSVALLFKFIIKYSPFNGPSFVFSVPYLVLPWLKYLKMGQAQVPFRMEGDFCGMPTNGKFMRKIFYIYINKVNRDVPSMSIRYTSTLLIPPIDGIYSFKLSGFAFAITEGLSNGPD